MPRNPIGETPARDTDAAISAALVQQAGALRAAEKTANATREAAQTAAENARLAAIIAFVGAILAAMVAWRNGWLQTRTIQQMKHADFRQTWIDRLREDLARFTRIAAKNEGAASPGELRECISTVILRMNKDDPDYNELVRLMGSIAAKSANSELSGSVDELSHYLLVAQQILKREWEVTKHDMHATPWGRPFSWIVSWRKRRQHAEQNEIARHIRVGQAIASPKLLGVLFFWRIQWHRPNRPPRDLNKPMFRLGHLEILMRPKK